MYKVIIGDVGGAFEFTVNKKNVRRMFSADDAEIIEELISLILPGFIGAERRVNDMDYIVEEIKPCLLPRSELDIFL